MADTLAYRFNENRGWGTATWPGPIGRVLESLDLRISDRGIGLETVRPRRGGKISEDGGCPIGPILERL